MIRVLYFARLREQLGLDAETIDPVPATVADLVAQLRARGGPWPEVLAGTVLFAVNQEMARGTTPLHDGDEVGLFPPVTGG
jgi:molybdopterin synthase sulfur carrier subunit